MCVYSLSLRAFCRVGGNQAFCSASLGLLIPSGGLISLLSVLFASFAGFFQSDLGPFYYGNLRFALSIFLSLF